MNTHSSLGGNYIRDPVGWDRGRERNPGARYFSPRYSDVRQAIRVGKGEGLVN